MLIAMGSCKKDEDDTQNTVKDIDGNIYKTVTIGTQVWMAENLKTTKYNDGTTIPLVTEHSNWAGLSSPAFCWNNNDIANKPIYGALYNFHTINSGNLCPTGWHIPTDAEWTILTNYAGGESVAGGKLKSTLTAPDTHPRWDSPNTGATDEYGFSALPGGVRGSSGDFPGVGYLGYWWSSTELDATAAWYWYMGSDREVVISSHCDKGYGFSVRCLRDN